MSRRSRAVRTPLPTLVVLLGALGGCAIVLPLLGLGTRVGWTELPTVLSSQSARLALGLSLRTCVVSTAVSVLLGVPLALLLARDWPGVRVARVIAVLPMTMPPVVAGIALLATLGSVGIPLEGLAFIAGVDRILDMARTALNVVGNALAALVIAKWEGQYDAVKGAAYEREQLGTG